MTQNRPKRVRNFVDPTLDTIEEIMSLYAKVLAWTVTTLAASTFLCSQCAGQDSELMSPELLWKLGRVGSATISSDGETVVFTVRRYQLKENAGKSTLYQVNTSGGKPTPLLSDWKSISSLQFAKTKSGERLFFEGIQGQIDEDKKDDPSNSNQAFALDLESLKIAQVTHIKDGIANFKVSPTGDKIAFTLDIKMDKEVTELYADLPKADARIIDGLMYRHWNAWHDYKYSHLHTAKLDDSLSAGKTTDLMKGIKADCPVPPFAGSEHFAWSPDGNQLAFTMKVDKRWAESTNSDVYLVAADGTSAPKNISQGRMGYDNDPFFSPDGKTLAFHSMAKAGFESDRNRIMLYDLASGKLTEATQGLDQMAHSGTWTPDSKEILIYSETLGTDQIFRIDRAKNGATQVTSGKFNWHIVEVFPDGKSALATRSSMIRPTELFVVSLDGGTPQQLTDVNAPMFANLSLPTVKEKWVKATDGKKIHCWIIYPPNFDPNKKYPMLTYCQGGPQGQIGQWFSYRWNFHLMASKGYIVLAPNRRGLPGFGQKWNDQISGDWGGQAMKDLLSATDEMLKQPYVDANRVGAIGASFGGYTVYWMMGNSGDRFATMIAHCGVFNLESMYGATEELFFVNWDLGGPYWKNKMIQSKYNQFSPHQFVKNWKTPLLVIHGEKDFRVPVTQGMEAFTAAQVQNVKSRFLYYPNEGHWVQQPQNGVLWHRVFFQWLEETCQK